MTDEQKLLPCPFCGSGAEQVDAVEAGPNAYCISCNGCGASSAVVFATMDSPDGHLRYLWNRRALSTPSGAPRTEYDAIADAVCEVAEYAADAFRKAGLEPSEWDGDNVVVDVGRGIAGDIERLAAPSGAQQEAVAWVIPTDITSNGADAGGWIDARIDKDGEFTMPLYTHPTPSTAAQPVVEDLLALAEAVYYMLDDSEEVTTDEHIIQGDHYRKVVEITERLDALPDDRPGYTMSFPGKARWALRGAIRTWEQP